MVKFLLLNQAKSGFLLKPILLIGYGPSILNHGERC